MIKLHKKVKLKWDLKILIIHRLKKMKRINKLSY